MSRPLPEVHRIARFGLTTPDARRLAGFYETALGARPLSSERIEGADFRRLMAVTGGARRICLSVGHEIIEMLEFDVPGAPYPAGTSALDPLFQHFAIVVAGMQGAWQRLQAAPDWTAISNAGPQLLPQRSGGVTAYKFRDPDGHPLELLEFPPAHVPPHWRGRAVDGTARGIDHSAISVASTERSRAFFTDMGFAVTGETHNRGPEQAQLDGLPGAQATVTALAPPAAATPHLELLCYRHDRPSLPVSAGNNDVAATRLVLTRRARQPAGEAEILIRDPDGHRLQLVASDD